MTYFTFDLSDSAPKSSDFGLVITGKNHYDFSSYEQEFTAIDGRNGDSYISRDRIPNIKITYEVTMPEVTDVNMRGLRQWLMSVIGYTHIYDTIMPTEFRIGVFDGDIEWSLSNLQRTGKTSITFNCNPLRYLLMGDHWTMLTGESIAYDFDRNQGEDAYPLIELMDIHGFVAVYMYNMMDGAKKTSQLSFEVPTTSSRVTIDSETASVTYFDYTDGKTKALPFYFTGSEADFFKVMKGSSESAITFANPDNPGMRVRLKPRWAVL